MRWLARGEAELPPDDDWLAPQERARLAGMRFTKRRTEYRLRRWTGKQAVAAVSGLEPTPAVLASVAVLNAPSGAPYVLVGGVPIGVDVSLTDRAGWAVCLVAPAGSSVRVGVDLEIVEPRSDGFVAGFLTPQEQRLVRAAPTADQRHATANLLWSAKESALKVLRVGLRADTRWVQVRPDPVTRPDGWGALDIDLLPPAGRGTGSGDGTWGTTGSGDGMWGTGTGEGGGDGSGGRRLTGWWRRDGVFVLTLAADRPFEPPARLAAGADLGAAVPVHSWTAAPVAW